MTTHTTPSVSETVERLKKASEDFRSEIQQNPERAKDFLVRAGIVRRSEANPSGVELVPELRSEG